MLQILSLLRCTSHTLTLIVVYFQEWLDLQINARNSQNRKGCQNKPHENGNTFVHWHVWSIYMDQKCLELILVVAWIFSFLAIYDF